MKLGKTGGFAEGRARRGDFSMVRRGWRDFLYLNNATAEAKAKVFLDLGKAVAAGTIENVGCERARLRVLRIAYGEVPSESFAFFGASARTEAEVGM